jgi:hypothetical protein
LFFLGMLFRYFLNDFETVPVALIVTGITSGFTLHMLCISIVRSLSHTNLLKWQYMRCDNLIPQMAL